MNKDNKYINMNVMSISRIILYLLNLNKILLLISQNIFSRCRILFIHCYL